MRVKICGITTPETAIACLKAGADMIGLVHYPPSPRHVDVAQIREILDAVAQHGQTVLVVVDQLPEEIDSRITYIQSYGKTRHDVLMSPIHVVKDYESFTHLLESPPGKSEELYCLEMSEGRLPGGNGAAWDWSLARPFCERYPTFIAGGITPDNVAEVIRQVNPYGVDVSSSIESLPGVKDLDKVKRLMDAVRQAAAYTMHR